MPVPLLGLLRWMGGRGSLRRALVSGDACPEGVMSELERELGSRLFPHYGSREMCLGGAVTCPAHEGMHLRENHILAEIVSPGGEALPDGEWGELVITTLDMQAMPLIRYRTGDYTRFLPGQCPCGGVTRRLAAVRRMPEQPDIVELDSALFALPGLIDYSARLDGGVLRIDAAGSVPAADIERAARGLCPRLELKVCVRTVSPAFRGCYPGKRQILRQLLPEV